MFIYMPKINFSICFFLEILHFKESCFDWLTAFWPITRKPEFCQIWDWWRDINNNISFHFRLLPRKNNDKIFQKTQKTLLLGHFGHFLPNFGQKWISLEKRALSVFIYSDYLPSCQKSEKTTGPFLRKTPNWQTDRRKDFIYWPNLHLTHGLD